MDNFNEIPLESQQGLALFNWKTISSFLHGRIKFLRNAKKVPKEQSWSISLIRIYYRAKSNQYGIDIAR